MNIEQIEEKLKEKNLSKEEQEIVDYELKEMKYYEIKTGKTIEKMIEKEKFNEKIYCWYLLGFIEENPLEKKENTKDYDFIRTESKPPDIDIDLTDDYKPLVIKDLADLYGGDHVSHIGTFSKYSYKSALKDIFRVFGIPAGVSNSITKKLTDDWETQLKENVGDIKNYLFKVVEKFPDRYEKWENVFEDLIKLIKDMDGQIRQTSVHASGILISDLPLNNQVPLKVINNTKTIKYTTEWDLGNLEDAGYLKIDLLGLRTLSIINETCKLIKEKKGIDIDLENIDLDDPKLFETIDKKNVDNIFQIGTKGGRWTSELIKPHSFKDIVAITSLNRPGTKSLIDDYIKNEKKIIHPSIDKHIKDTNYVILFQEQINRILADFLEIDEGEADLLRRNLEKNKDEKKLKKMFFEKSKKDDKEIKIVFDYLLKSAGYLFNKSHAVAYSIITMATLYLKTYYPLYFYTTSLQYPNNEDGRAGTSIEMKKNEYVLKNPNINKSKASKFEINEEENCVYYSLSSIKGVGIDPAMIIEEHQPYKNFGDFMEKTKEYKRKINKTKMGNLIKIGAFDDFCENRKLLFNIYDDKRASKKMNMLLWNKEIKTRLNEDDVKDYNSYTKEKFMIDLLETDGNLLKAKLLEDEKQLKQFRKEDVLLDFNEIPYHKVSWCVFEVKSSFEKVDKNNNLMAFLQVSDFYGNLINLTVFSSIYKENKKFFKEKNCLIGEVKKQSYRGKDSLLLTDNFNII